jgi:hypothetical protein
MKRFLCALCVLCGLGVQASALDREAFTFTKYDLDVRVEPEQRRLAVRGEIVLRNDSKAPQKYIVLQISSSLGWRSIRLGGKPVQFVSQSYTSDIDHTGSLSEAIVTLPAEIPPQGTAALEIGYEGTVSLDATRLTRVGVPEEVAKHTDWDQISPSLAAIRGVGYVAWYPIATEAANLSDNSLFDTIGRWKNREGDAGMILKVNSSSVPADIPATTVLCDGEQFHGVTKGGSPQLPWLQCNYDPFGLMVPTLVIGNYDYLGDRALDVYHLPGHRAEAESYQLAAEVVSKFVSEWFGPLRSKAAVAELPDRDWAPFESGGLLLTPLTADNTKESELTAVSQLTHAALVSPRSWISQGLMHFAQALYREQQDGRQAALDFMTPHGQTLEAAEKKSNDSTGDSLINTFREEFYRTKAMYVWWMLRDMVGESALKKALADYHPEQDKEPSYTQRLVEAQSKKDLEWFFDDWVYRDRGLPDFRVASVYPRKTLRGIYLVTVTLENLGHAGAEVPITVRFEGGETKARLEVRGDSHASVRVETSALPEEVIVNDGSVPEADLSNNTFKVQIAPDAP